MAVVLDISATGGSATTGSASETVSINIPANSNRCLVVIVTVNGSYFNTNTYFTATYNGTPMSLITTVTSVGGDQWMLVYRTVNPASGTNNIVVSQSGSPADTGCVYNIVGLGFSGVDQVTPFGTPQTFAIQGSSTFDPGPNACGVGITPVAGQYVLAAGQVLYVGGPITMTGFNSNPKYIRNGTATTGTSVATLTASGAPSYRVLGDLEICVLAKENDATSSTSSSGWNKLAENVSSTVWSQAVYWRIYNGTNVDPVFTWTGAVDCHAQRILYRNAQVSGTPVKTLGTFGNGTTSTHTSTSGNSTGANSTAAYLDSCNANTALTAPSGWTQNYDDGSATGPYRESGGTKELTTAGSASGSISTTGGAARWIQSQIEILCAATGPQTQLTNSTTANSPGLVTVTATESVDANYNQFGWTTDHTYADPSFQLEAYAVGINASASSATGAGTVNGAASITGRSGSAGTVNGTASITGASGSAGTVNGAASIAGTSGSAGTVNGTSNTSGVSVSAGAGTVNGAASITGRSGSAGTVNGTVSVNGSSSNNPIGAGTVNGTSSITGASGSAGTVNGAASITGVSGSAGTVNGAASITGVSGSAGTVNGAASIAGTSGSAGTVNGTVLVAGVSPSSSTSGAGTVNGVASITGASGSAGTVNGTSSINGTSLTINTFGAGTVNGTSTVNGVSTQSVQNFFFFF